MEAVESIRPRILKDFVGQKQVVENLRIFIEAAISRKNEALDHILLCGPPGLGKTTLAQIIARELGVNFRITSGPLLTKPGSVAAVLSSLNKKEVLFIDEIHRMTASAEEVLYPALEDYRLDLVVGEGASAKILPIKLPPFTLIGATTRIGLLSAPLRDRFGIHFNFDLYSIAELNEVLRRGAELVNLKASEDSWEEISMRSRGTPRIAIRILRRLRDFLETSNHKILDRDMVIKALVALDIDPLGLSGLDRAYLKFIAGASGPLGIDNIAVALYEKKDNLEEVIEPHLIRTGLIERTSRGRIITPKGNEYISTSTSTSGSEKN